jgi:class 3 adenylate cyclase
VESPTGVVTLLFTDIEGSTRLWEEHPEAMNRALAGHAPSDSPPDPPAAQ